MIGEITFWGQFLKWGLLVAGGIAGIVWLERWRRHRRATSTGGGATTPPSGAGSHSPSPPSGHGPAGHGASKQASKWEAFLWFSLKCATALFFIWLFFYFFPGERKESKVQLVYYYTEDNVTSVRRMVASVSPNEIEYGFNCEDGSHTDVRWIRGKGGTWRNQKSGRLPRGGTVEVVNVTGDRFADFDEWRQKCVIIFLSDSAVPTAKHRVVMSI